MSESPHAGGAYQKGGVAMASETLYALAALATIGGFILELIQALARLIKRRKTRRMARQEELPTSSENK